MKIDSNKKLKKFLNDNAARLRSDGKINKNSYKLKTESEIGSIPLEDIEYSDQQELKSKALAHIFDLNIELIPSPKIYEYRFKMDYVASFNPFFEPQNRLGQRKQKRFNHVEDMSESVLFNKELFSKLREVYKLMLKLDIRTYDLVKHDGNLRYLVVKSHGNESMLIIVTKELIAKDNIEKISERASELGFKSIYFQLNESKTDVSFGKTYAQFGEESLIINILESNYYVGPETFFQNNLYLFPNLINYVAAELSKLGKTSILYDLYSGVGTFGIQLANVFDSVIGIDNNPENIDYLNQNLEMNKITNYGAKLLDLNNDDFGSKIIKEQTVIVDPPRTGLEKNGVNHIKKLKPKYIIYVSCNPITQKKDMDELTEDYQAISMKAFDMFPHTHHLENVAILKRF